MSEFEVQRLQLWAEIDSLLNRKELLAARKARLLLCEWLEKYPQDYFSREGGEEVAMMEEALEIIEAEKSAQLIAA